MRQLLLLIFVVGGNLAFAQDFMLQGWYWDYPSQNCGGLSTKWAAHLESQVNTLSNTGFTFVWLPPPAKGGSECSVGYDPKDLYDLGDYGDTRYGSRAQLNSLLSALQGRGIQAVADVVYNHRDGGDWEDNPAVRNYVMNYPSVGNTCNNGVTPYPVNGKVRWRLPLGGSTGNNAGSYYFKFSSASGGSGFYGRSYKINFQTSVVGWQGLSDENEVEPNGGGDCGTPNDQTLITLGRNMVASIDNVGGGECGVDEFQVDLLASQFNASGDFLEIYIEQNGGDGTGIDIRPYGLWAAPRSADVINELTLQTRTDFTNLPSGLGPMNYLNFKPNGVDPTCLEGDWDFPYFFFDVDQRQASTQTVYNEWSEWLIDDVGFTGGLRMDAVKHFDPSMVTALLNYLGDQGIEPPIIVGEIFDSNIGKLNGWVNDVNNGLTADVDVRVFDFNLRQSLKDACDQYYFNFFYDVRNVFNSGMVAAGASPFNVVTFVNNHDFRGNNEPVQDDPELAYAYLLTNNKVGLPCVFYPDIFADQPPNYPNTNLQTEVAELIDIHNQYIFGAVDHYYLNDFGTPYASNYISGNANQCLIYQISGGPTNQDVIVAINFDDVDLKVNQQVNMGNVAFGGQFDDVIGNSEFPFAVVDNSGGVSNNIYISLPPRSYSVWVYDPLAPLPANLTTFTAKLQEQQVKLEWEATLEENLAYYGVERSIDGKNFTQIGQVPAKGNSTTTLSYALMDKNLPKAAAKLYYRLAMVDLDGTVNHSPIRAVEQPVSNVRVWPNPVQDQLTFEQLPEEDVQLEVRDLNGRLIYQTQLQEKRGVIPTASWRAGVYQLRLRVNGRLQYNDRIIKF